ncbi:MAG: 2-dehydro-3-deoxyphosphogluconate aldolase / (4S)-4-hydroxy-2-oxoglutarate aldolase [Actinomycetota bacterium]|nr:2-dehydro-3-deoxyphosphogluconate aldolase / (4S)-4-hydroxy-2-oxoglutarate aldolase [Actinomycetota bacterium]
MPPERPALPRELVETGVVAIARAAATTRVAAAVETLIEAGVCCIELTLTMPGAVASIETLVRELGDRACIGAGTVLTAEQARACIGAGAAFLVAPSAVPDVVAVALEAGVPCLPGALSPSEVVAAWQSGASAVKLFPASVGGVKYLRDLRAPLPDNALIPTGGIAIDDIAGYVAAGAVAVGVGGPLFADALDPGGPGGPGDLGALAARAARALGAVREGRLLRAERSA